MINLISNNNKATNAPDHPVYMMCIRVAYTHRTLKNIIDYLIFTQLDKRELNMLDQDINLDISLQEFQDINTNLKRYEFILIDEYNEYKFMRI